MKDRKYFGEQLRAKQVVVYTNMKLRKGIWKKSSNL